MEANGEFLSVNWNVSGGGAFALIPLTRPGKLPDLYPVCRGHTAAVLDTSFSPFDDHVVASGGDDAQVSIWKVSPEEVVERLDNNKDGALEDFKPLATFAGGRRRVGQVQFHPTASNVLAAATGDHAIKLFDTEKQKAQIELTGFTDSIQSMTFDWTGSTIAATCRDRKLRLFDTRTPKAVHTVDGHGGIKGARAVWCGDKPRLITSGFSKMSERQMFLWDVAQPAKPLKTVSLDSSNGIIMPFWSDNNVVFLAGKGDGNIRYYELESDEIHYLAEYKSVEPQSGMAFLPRRSLNVDENEIARAYKVTSSMVQPVSFYVPRKADSFQADIFPLAQSNKPALTADEFFVDKETKTPNLLDFENKSIITGDATKPTLDASEAASSAAAEAKEKEDAAKEKEKAAKEKEEKVKEEKAVKEAKKEEAKKEGEKEDKEKEVQAKEKEQKEKEQKEKEAKAAKEKEDKEKKDKEAKDKEEKEKKDKETAHKEESSPTAALAGAGAGAAAAAATAASSSSASPSGPAATSSATTDASAEIEDLKAQIAERDTRIRELEMENLKYVPPPNPDSARTTNVSATCSLARSK